MSDIKKARELIIEALKLTAEDRVKRKLGRALQLMRREPPIRRAKPLPQVLSEETRQAVKRMALDTSITEQQITTALGLRNSRIVSHILNGKR